jgi:hypothetical protein
MKNLFISEAVLSKLKTSHGVARNEVEQCFFNRTGKPLVDLRAINRTAPPTQWFIACTNRGRALKVVYMQKGDVVELKTAYEPNSIELKIYARFG